MINLFSFTLSISIALTKDFPFILISMGRSKNPIGQSNSYARSWIIKGGKPDWINTEWGKEIIEEYKNDRQCKSSKTL